MCIKHGKKVPMRELIQPIKTQFFFISYEVDQIYMTNCTRQPIFIYVIDWFIICHMFVSKKAFSRSDTGINLYFSKA